MLFAAVTVALVCGGAATAQPQPFSRSLDQGVPCPEGSEDYALGSTGAAAPIDPTEELKVGAARSPVSSLAGCTVGPPRVQPPYSPDLSLEILVLSDLDLLLYSWLALRQWPARLRCTPLGLPCAALL